jgi:hypothetical protein
MNGADASAEGPISGVPLAQYAAVTAALAAAHPLKAVLAAEGIDARSWAQADAGWTVRLDADASLLARYEAALAAAADRLERTVEPIDADVAAWAAFLAALARDAEALLQQHGITHDDVARLRRAWDARTAADPGVRQRLAELRHDPGPLPALRVVKAKLRSSGAGLSAEALAPEPAARSYVPLVAPSQAAIAPPPLVAMPASPAHGAEERLAIGAANFDIDDPSTIVLSPAVAAAAGGARPFAPLDESTVALASPLPVGGALPFRAGRPAPAVAAPRMPVARPLVEDALPKLYDEPVAETETKALNHVPNAGSALPFAPAREASAASSQAPRAPGESPSLTLDQHAALCLEVAVDPARADEALGRFHVTAADKAHLDEIYRARLQADPALRARWNVAFETHRRWVASRLR